MIIIEPNLRSPAGHYLEFIRALALKSKKCFSVFCHSDGDIFLENIPNIKIYNQINRKSKLSEWNLIYKLLKSKEKFLILTADSKHVFYISLLSKILNIKPNNVYLYFHRVLNKKKDKILMNFSDITKKSSIVINPTNEIYHFFKTNGWKNINYIPYPAIPPNDISFNQSFKYLLVAGALRANKGLGLILELIKLLKEKKANLPIKLQITKKHFNKHGHKEKNLLEDISQIKYPYLFTYENPPDREEYLKNFNGALVLAPYDKEIFKYQVSGIVLDALLCGSPVITTEGTWAGNVVKEFNAGELISKQSIQEFYDKIEKVLMNWSCYKKNAENASFLLAERHNPDNLLNLLGV